MIVDPDNPELPDLSTVGHAVRDSRGERPPCCHGAADASPGVRLFRGRVTESHGRSSAVTVAQIDVPSWGATLRFALLLAIPVVGLVAVALLVSPGVGVLVTVLLALLRFLCVRARRP